MRISDLEIKIDWNQRSTIRGATWVIGSAIATLYLFINQDPMGFSTIMGSTGIVAGSIGVAVKD